jgi:chromosome segregation ATPase
MKNYNEVISALREVARDFLRLRRINSIRTDILEVNNEIKATEDEILAYKKDIARAEFRTNSLVEADPDFEDKKKTYQETKESHLKSIESLEKHQASLRETVADLNAKINDISAGKSKVDKDELESITQDLLGEYTKEHALNVAVDLVETPAPETTE